jgi:uncharacterized protein YfaS (alpha-2-macroglobulin family)
MSRVLPDAIVARMQKELPLPIADDAHLKEELPLMIADGLQKLYDFQHHDGGWGWWKDDESTPFNTAYVLYGLHAIQQADFAVDKDAIERAVSYLLSWLDHSTIDTKPLYHHHEGTANSANTRAYSLYVLAELGRGERGLSVRLFEQREKLGYYGRAYLALALFITNDYQADAYVETILDELREVAITSDGMTSWEEINSEPWTMNTDVRTSAIILDALVRIAPDDPLIGPTVRWLMAVRQNGFWGSTQSTAASLIALVDYLLVSGELEADYTYRVLVGGKEVASGSVDKSNLAVPGRVVIPLTDLPAETAHRVEILRQATPGQTGRGSLYVSLIYRHYSSGQGVPPMERGIRLQRTYALSGEDRAITQARLGNVVEVKVSVQLDASADYLVVEDPLPAGLEPIDTSLAVTGRQYGGENRDWRWAHIELRDEKVALFATYLRPGTYTYTYLARATTPGLFRVLPGEAYPMYAPETYGRGEGSIFIVDAQ